MSDKNHTTRSGMASLFLLAGQDKKYSQTRLKQTSRLRQNLFVITRLIIVVKCHFFTSQHTIGYQSFEASRKMTRHQQSLTWHGFDTTSI